MSTLVRGRRWASRPSTLDIAIAGLFVALTAAETFTVHDDREPWQHAVAMLALAGLAWRRIAPVTTAFVLVVADQVTNPAGRFSTVLALVLVSYTVGFETKGLRRYLGLALVLVPFVGASALRPSFEVSDLAAATAFIGGPWLVGVATAARAESSARAIARAERAEREQGRLAAEAVADERARIARELHDVVAHSLTVVTIQLQAVRRRLGEDHADEARDLAAAETVTREAMGEMRRLLGVLRGGGEGDLAPQPGLSELPTLVERLDTPRTRVRLAVEGDPGLLSPGMDLAVFRVAQEAITNATRHAHASAIDVRLGWSPSAVELEVCDDGVGIVGDPASGHGLVGMRERVALYGGELAIGPGEGTGLVVRARFPREVTR
ncbi:sensor histidine kinase [Demequina iriomotensis]|uniref:sensor histidine kinase n=1 Tax=Demequina iriomotensis TaxID=1536641 RepID=UPI000780AE53|nr:sensor histidine kinase [Demequina iriomotensis]